MKKRQNSTRWLGLALACGTLTFAVSTQAAKPPKPPPTPTGPAYRIVSLGTLGGGQLGASAINHVGWVAGGGYNASGESVACVVVPEPSANGPVYFRDTNPADGINDLIHALPGLPNSQNFGAYDLNDVGMVAGACMADNGSWWYEKATLWVGNTPIDLGYFVGDDTEAYGVNDRGLVVIGPYRSGFAWLPSYVVVPKDNDGDGVPDTWFEDLNGDGSNDLLKLISQPTGYDPVSGYWEYAFAPECGINDAGQIVLNGWGVPSFRLTPDSTDADGDGNPWFADANGDGFNDLMVQLIGLGGADSFACDINAAGQVVGSCNNRAVLWNFAADETQTIIDLGLLSKQVLNMGAVAINDVGQIVGNAYYRNSSRATFLVQNGKMYDLAALLVNGAAWTYLTANDINNQGIITGNAYLDGVWQGFVAIPVTQP